MKQWLKSRQYQKSAISETGTRLSVERRLRQWFPMLALVVAACSSVDAQQGQAVARDVERESAPSIRIPPVKLIGLPPTPQTPAFEAVLAAREANASKQWSVLGMAAPQAKGDVLEAYPAFWLLNYQIWNAPASSFPRAEVTRFLQNNDNTYLAERLRGNWILASVRRGDFKTARDLGNIPHAGSQTQCAILEARHMTGQRAKAQEALEIFSPGTDCWHLYDQLVADGVLGWEHIQPQLRAALELNKTADARKFATSQVI
jgi:soluble lytic murein transglycosylase